MAKNYFENVYLGKKAANDTLKTSKQLQKILTAKAVNRSIDSKKLTNSDYKKMHVNSPKTSKKGQMDLSAFINPFELI